MYRIGICDDDVTVCSEIENHLQEYAGRENIKIETDVFLSGTELCRAIEEEKILFHLLFLDIELGDSSGVSVGNMLREKLYNETTQIVFISYSREYAMQLFKIRPMDFLLKPIQYEKIHAAMQLYRKLYSGNKFFFEYKKGKRNFQIAQEEIICVKCEGKKIHLVTTKEEIDFYGKMADAGRQLEAVKFWSIHKSFIINIDYVYSFGKDEIHMVNGDVLPISKAHRKEIMMKVLERKKWREQNDAF
ncbi:MAG: response regulator transcription factor [Lachnospiraceae bacterium]|nr:response regulator transcription factor [Lachnospiraceae bacterium]